MSYIITNKSKLEGTAYIEIFPGKYDGSHWNDNSVFFEERHWEYLTRIIHRHYPEYDPYGFQSLSNGNWKPILNDLQDLAKRIEKGQKIKDIRNEISFMSKYTEAEFKENEESNLNKLKQTIEQFTSWVKESLQSSQFVSILGL